MEWSSLNSLAEVGVGVNLAFGLVKNVRQRFSDLFDNSLKTKADKIKAILNESKGLKNGNGRGAKEAIRLDDISQHYRAFASWTERALVAAAFCLAFALTYFLYESALDPSRSIPDAWAATTLVIVWLPLSLSILLHALYYRVACVFLNHREKSYKGMVKLIDSVLAPTPVDDALPEPADE